MLHRWMENRSNDFEQKYIAFKSDPNFFSSLLEASEKKEFIWMLHTKYVINRGFFQIDFHYPNASF